MTSKMLYLLGELKRQMNGAVSSSMRYYGTEYGLNYGVSVATIRELGRSQTCDHRLAEYLWEQDIRELKLIALWLADPAQVDLKRWQRGVINSEVAEEGAFVLFSKVAGIEQWLYDESAMVQYCALMSLAGGAQFDMESIKPRLIEILGEPVTPIPQGVIALLESHLRRGARAEVQDILDSLPQNIACDNIRSEMAWRLEI